MCPHSCPRHLCRSVCRHFCRMCVFFTGNKHLLLSARLALMIHGGGYVTLSRRAVRPAQTRHLLRLGFLPVSIDYRLCPEVNLIEGPMTDVCDALRWARATLPGIMFSTTNLLVDGGRVVAVGWSTGGHLAMSLGWTAMEAGIQPPSAVLSFYAPTDFESGGRFQSIQIVVSPPQQGSG